MKINDDDRLDDIVERRRRQMNPYIAELEWREGGTHGPTAPVVSYSEWLNGPSEAEFIAKAILDAANGRNEP